MSDRVDFIIMVVLFGLLVAINRYSEDIYGFPVVSSLIIITMMAIIVGYVLSIHRTFGIVLREEDT